MQLSIFASQMRWTLADIPTRVHRRVGTIRKLGAFCVRVKIAWLIIRILPVECPLCFNAPPAALDCLVSSILQESAQSFCRAAWWPASHALLGLFGMLSALGMLGLGLMLKEISNLKDETRCFSHLANRRWPAQLPTVARASACGSGGLRSFGSGRFCEDGWLRG